MKAKLLGAACLVAGGVFAGQAHADCGRTTIAEMNWASALFMAYLDQFILTHGYGCDVEVVPGDTVPTSTSMIEKGEPDIAPELWTNSITEPLERAVDEGRLVVVTNSLVEGGEEGFWVPKYMVDERPELATIEGVRANAELFEHPEDPSKSALIGCPSGWACQISARNLFTALELEEVGFELVDPGSAAGLDGAIARAYERGLPIFSYYWAPTSLLGRYDMVKVDFGSGIDEEHYANCISQVECENPRPTMYPSSPVMTTVTADFAESSPEALAYLKARMFRNADLSGVLAWMEENQADGETAAIFYLENNEDTWTSWVSTDAADKIKASLANM